MNVNFQVVPYAHKFYVVIRHGKTGTVLARSRPWDTFAEAKDCALQASTDQHVHEHIDALLED